MAQLVEVNQIGKREDLRDFISIVDMKEKPLLAMIPKIAEAQNMLMSWQADAYATPIGAGIADGEDVSAYENSAVSRALIQNFCQKWRRTAMVGDLAENVSNVAGAKAGELARAIDKKFEEIGRDIEMTLCSDNDQQLEVGIGTPYKTKALGAWISNSGGSVNQVALPFRTPTASINLAATLWTEATAATGLQPILASMFQQYGKQQNLVGLIGTTGKIKVTNFNQAIAAAGSAVNVRTFTNTAEERTITQTVDTYKGDFNTVELHTSLLMCSTVGTVLNDRLYLLAMEVLGLAFNRPPKVQRLPNLGGGPRAYVDAIAGLVYKNPLVGGKVIAIT